MKDRRLKRRRSKRASLKRRSSRKRVGGVNDLSPFLQDECIQINTDIQHVDFYTQTMQKCKKCKKYRPKDLFDCKNCAGRENQECYYTNGKSNDDQISCDLKYIANGIGPEGQFEIKNNIVAVRYSEEGRFPWIMMSDALNIADFHVLIIPGITPSTGSPMSEAMKSIGGLFKLSNADILLREMIAFRDAVCQYIVKEEGLPEDIYASPILLKNVAKFRKTYQSKFINKVKQNIANYIVSGFNYPGSQELLHMQIVLSPTMWGEEYTKWVNREHFETPRFIPTETLTEVVSKLVDATKQYDGNSPIPFGKINLSYVSNGNKFTKRYELSTFWQAIGDTSTIMQTAQEQIDGKRKHIDEIVLLEKDKGNREFKTIPLSNTQFFQNKKFVDNITSRRSSTRRRSSKRRENIKKAAKYVVAAATGVALAAAVKSTIQKKQQKTPS